jgi:acyl-coenzyme A thioesterase PaaI-like protein
MAIPFDPPVVDLTPAEIAREREVYGGLTSSVRRLMEASMRTTVGPDEITGMTRSIDELSARLEKEMVPGSLGVTITSDGHARAHGNAVVGMRNPVAVPLRVTHDPSGRAAAEFHLGPLYEGPPGLVHGGVVALVLDQIFGEAAAAGGAPGMTGTLTIRYTRATPLGDCSAEAWTDRVEGLKTFVKGEMRDAKGRTTAEAEGVFILPRWAREAIEKGAPKPSRFE